MSISVTFDNSAATLRLWKHPADNSGGFRRKIVTDSCRLRSRSGLDSSERRGVGTGFRRAGFFAD